MNKTFKNIGRVCAFALMTAAIAVPTVVQAAVHVDFGNVSVGYRDGYQDNHHQWHRWSHRSDAVAYRSHNQQNYRDKNPGTTITAPDNRPAAAMARQRKLPGSSGVQDRQSFSI
jgi:hypothetical protein